MKTNNPKPYTNKLKKDRDKTLKGLNKLNKNMTSFKMRKIGEKTTEKVMKKYPPKK